VPATTARPISPFPFTTNWPKHQIHRSMSFSIATLNPTVGAAKHRLLIPRPCIGTPWNSTPSLCTDCNTMESSTHGHCPMWMIRPHPLDDRIKIHGMSRIATNWTSDWRYVYSHQSFFPLFSHMALGCWCGARVGTRGCIRFIRSHFLFFCFVSGLFSCSIFGSYRRLMDASGLGSPMARSASRHKPSRACDSSRIMPRT
jgi:hypothetical protein